MAVVTGGASGIGLACVERLAADDERAAIAIADLQPPPDALVAALGDRLYHAHVDVSDPDAMNVFAAEAANTLGAPTRLVCAAGVQLKRAAAELTAAQWRRVLGVNLDGVWWACSAVGRMMIERGGGSIVAVGSISMRFGLPGRLPYVTAKAAIEGLTSTLAVEWAPHGVRVNAVAPGQIETPLVQRGFEEGYLHRDASNAAHALGRLGTPAEVAAAIAFLLDDREAGFVTGEVLCVDGGFQRKKAL
ncbi:MAG TPA: SDR family oxidoreductase [Conexibacter sp.]